MAYVYLADRSQCPLPTDACAWGRPPRYVEDVIAGLRREVREGTFPGPEHSFK